MSDSLSQTFLTITRNSTDWNGSKVHWRPLAK